MNGREISALASLPASEPYSIFDKRQTALIVTIVSIAATCKFLSDPQSRPLLLMQL